MTKRRKSPAQHFEKRVERSSGCWEWLGVRDKDGYGRFCFVDTDGKTRNVRAHRFSYETLTGKTIGALTIDHLCRNRGCVNPAHLEPVTIGLNSRRGVAARGRAAHCAMGHAFDDGNTYNHRGRRVCRKCNLAAVKRYQQKIGDAA